MSSGLFALTIQCLRRRNQKPTPVTAAIPASISDHGSGTVARTNSPKEDPESV
jgi:hypothetical protein